MDNIFYSEYGVYKRIFVATSLQRDTRMKCVRCVCCSPVTPEIMNHSCVKGFGVSGPENVCVSMCM